MWQKCLEIIRTEYGEKHKTWFDAWFKGVEFYNYDPVKHKLTAKVPHRYVYVYLETDGAERYRKAVKKAFPDCTDLSYYIPPQRPSFAQIADCLQQQQDSIQGNHIHVANAKERLMEGMAHFLKGKPLQWLEGYDGVVDWLADNNGKGLLVVGATGLGKTLICKRVLPYLIGDPRVIKCVKATELHDRLDELKRERIVIIDDLGKEKRKHYGDNDTSFYELCDNAENTGNILIITTNLATSPMPKDWTKPWPYPDNIQERYGNDVLGRLMNITHLAIFEGDNLRK